MPRTTRTTTPKRLLWSVFVISFADKLGGDRARAADLDVAKALVRDQFHQRRLSRDRARRLSRDRASVLATWRGRYRDQEWKAEWAGV